MRVECAWCRKLMHEKPPFFDDRVSHSICAECTGVFNKQQSRPIPTPEPERAA